MTNWQNVVVFQDSEVKKLEALKTDHDSYENVNSLYVSLESQQQLGFQIGSQ